MNSAKKRPQGQCDVGPEVGLLSVGWGQSLSESCKIITATLLLHPHVSPVFHTLYLKPVHEIGYYYFSFQIRKPNLRKVK